MSNDLYAETPKKRRRLKKPVNRLMRRMKKKSRAIGFAVYLDTLAMLGRNAGDQAIESFFGSYRYTDDDEN